jgi:hypothetical protein
MDHAGDAQAGLVWRFRSSPVLVEGVERTSESSAPLELYDF